MQPIRREEDLLRSEAPKVPPNVLKELTRIGGLNDYGKPKVRVVWGGTERWFRCGLTRLKYPIKRKLRRLAAWNAVNPENGEKKHILVKGSKFVEIGGKRLIVTPDGKVPSPDDDAVMPVLPGWLLSAVYEDREIGYQGWVVEEWWPQDIVFAGRHKNPRKDHLRWHQPLDLFGMPVGPKIDILGPPPTEGEYRFLMYLDDGKEPDATPLDINDGSVIKIIEAAIHLRQAQGGADGWRGVQSPEKARELYRSIQADREKEEEAKEQGFENLLHDILMDGYAAKMRKAYLS